jgi:NADPH:quinone reductase-like Zn-dependent oxidoreductase
MKAIVCTRYGSPDVLRLADLAKPVPTDNEVLIKVRAASVNAFDLHFVQGKPLPIRLLFGLRKPKSRPGRDVAGQVEVVGSKVTQFKPGDEVFGVCPGAFAEYACAAEDKLALKPASVSFENAASLPIAAITALQGLRDVGRIQPDQRVLVDGASGGVGTFAVQIAKSYSAEVTAVCSTGKVDTARSLGADHVIDYTREDFTQSGRRYDLIFGANAYHSVFAYRRALTPNGIYAVAGGGGVQLLQFLSVGLFVSMIGSRKMRVVSAKIKQKDLAILAGLLESGKLVPVIDRCYPLNDAADALRYLEEGHARGKAVITVN